MATLYVTNNTRQHHQFTYRVPESDKLHEQTIPAGQQVAVVRDAGLETIEFIVKHNRKYGLREANEAKNLRAFAPLTYTVDKPTTADRILETFESNDNALNDSAEQRREDQAAVIAEGIQSTMREHGVDVPRTEVTIVEDTKGGQAPAVSEGYEIVAEGVQPRNGGKPGKRAARE